MAVSMALAPRSTFVRGGAYVLGHLRFEQLLKHPLEDLLKEAGVGQQTSCAICLLVLR